MLRPVRRWFARVVDPSRPARAPRRARRPGARLRLLALEGRVVPATFTVDTTADAGPGSLRQALLDANAAPGTDTVTFGPLFDTPQTIALLSALPDITDAVTVAGPEAPASAKSPARLTVRRDPTAATAFRIFTVAGPTPFSVTLSNMTITGGQGQRIGLFSYGGGLLGGGLQTVTLMGVAVTGNTAGFGGGVYMSGGALLLVNSTVSGNAATLDGGGGVSMTGGALLMESSTISGNTARAGGGIQFDGRAATLGLTIRNSTISGNAAASGSGGGIALYNFGGALLVQNSTITNNVAGAGDAADGVGGGGIALASLATGTPAAVTLQSTILAGNKAANGRADLVAVAGATVTADHSALGSGAGVTLSAASFANLPFGADLRLQPLADNGGPAPTHLLGPGSAAIDHGANPNALMADQRGDGFGRVKGVAADIGAVEVDSANLPVAALGPVANVTADGGTAYAFTITYADAVAIQVSTLDGGDVRVTGPNGYDVLASLLRADGTVDGTPLTATYAVTPPGGSWDAADYGTYTLAVEPNQVANTAGVAVPAGPLGTFVVQTPATFTVTNTNDAGPGSLRQAILDANARIGSADTVAFDTVVFATPRTVTLTSGELSITDPLTVAGPGAAVLTVNGGGVGRVFNVNGPGVFNVTLAGMTVTGGLTAADRGGALALQDENVTLSDSVLTGNIAGRDGGAVNVAGGGTLTVRRSTLTNNFSAGVGSAGDGGAINVQGPGTLLIQDSTLSGNVSAHSGGAVYLAPGAATLVIRNSTLSGNVSGRGGGAVYFALSGSLTVQNSTLSGNRAATAGGAVYFFGATPTGSLLLQNCTIAGNTAGTDGGGIALSSFSGTLMLQNCTVAGNAANGIIPGPGRGGGGIARSATVSAASGMVTLVNTIVAGNTSALGPTAADIASSAPGTVTAAFSAVGSDPGAGLFSAVSFGNRPFGADLRLQPLADNGGPTRTIALGPGSAALDAGFALADLLTDQRGVGFARVSGPAADLGAFEVQVPPPPVPPRVTGTLVNGGSAQRSMVTSLTVTFSAPVKFATTPQAAFTLTRTGGGAVGFTASAAIVNGVTVVMLDGFYGTEANAGSLNDGLYTLTVLAGQVTGSAGLALDGNGDGAGGDDFTFAEAQGLYRLFGDGNGDRFVNGLDLLLFRNAFGSGPHDPTYDPTFDYNGDRFVNGLDLSEFRARFGGSL